MSYRLLDEETLSCYGAKDTLLSRVYALLEHQRVNWDWCRDGHDALERSNRKMIDISGDTVILQHNPQRIVSVGASIKPADIDARPCFLCAQNIPVGQMGVRLTEHYVMLCNPRPIFPRHFTISNQQHSAQDIRGGVMEFLELLSLLGPDLMVFFNGALAGASAPDHMHYQACSVEELPLIERLVSENREKASDVAVEEVRYCGQLYHFIRGKNDCLVAKELESLISAHEKRIKDGARLINILGWERQGVFHVLVICRAKHRADSYYAEGGQKILVSPACVEVAGLIVTPREEDFEKITSKYVKEIFSEVIFQGASK